MNAAFIPVRGGSKSIPLKNIKPICGKPLIYWTAKAACECKYIDKVFISTDSSLIKDCIHGFTHGIEHDLFKSVEVIDRSERTALDTASTESAMLEFAEKYDFDNIVLIQATSPLLTRSDLDKGFEVYNSDSTDSVLSVVRQKRFIWATGTDGYSNPINYDHFNRPRRQNFDGFLVENGAFYITSKEALVTTGNRISGNIKTVEMPSGSYFEIDEEEDWIIIEALLKKIQDSSEVPIPEIKMLLTDCDGCLTDGGMYYSENGDELKKFNTHDGVGFSLLKEKGIVTGIITGEDVKLNERRASKLKLDILKPGCKDKLTTVKNLCREYNIDISNVCYIGDDLNDLEIIKAVGYGCAPANAVSSIKRAARYICEAKGGEGVIREVADRILSGK